MDFDVVLFLTFAEISMDEQTSEHLRELRIGAIQRLHGVLSYYAQLGYIPQLTTAIAEKKCAMIQEATTKAQIEQILKPRCPQYDGNRFIEDDSIIPEEELIWWSSTSLRAPLNSVGCARFQELFRRVFPNGIHAN